MDGARLQRRIDHGRGQAARHIGLPCRFYRPNGAANPLARGIFTMPVAINSGDRLYKGANEYGDPVWYGDFDGTCTQPGDYLQRLKDRSIWFIAAQQPLLPIILVECPRQIYASRVPESAQGGVVGYSSVATMTPILGTAEALWPCSILIGGRIERSTSGLPAAVREASWSILLPLSVPITILAGDALTDDLGRRFAVQSAELSDLGYRLLATEVHT